MHTPVVVAVDGGGSKTDAAVVTLDGHVLGRSRGPGCSHHQLGVADAIAVVDDTVRAALTAAGEVDITAAHFYLTGIDMPHEIELLTTALVELDWTPESVTVDNDVMALLRAGTDAADACVVVCGTGINGAARTSDGRISRVLSLGNISGDWGGGTGLIDEAIWHAARAADRRGPATQLHDAVLRWSGFESMDELAIEVHQGRYSLDAMWHRVPELFDLARVGDGVARELVERQADEIIRLAAGLCSRVGIEHSPIPLVLGGGIAASRDAILTQRLETTRADLLPAATITIVTAPPVVGAVLLALDDVLSTESPAMHDAVTASVRTQLS